MHYGHQKKKRAIRWHPQSVGNLALAPESLVVPHECIDTLRSPQIRLVQDVPQLECEEDWAADPLAPSKGILNGLILALMIWGFIALAAYGIVYL